MVFGSSIIKDSLRKRYSSEGDAQEGRLPRPPRRHVTFADIEELYEKYGGSISGDSSGTYLLYE